MTKIELINGIIDMVKEEDPNANIKRIENILSNQTQDEIYRVYDAFYRFGVLNVLENIG